MNNWFEVDRAGLAQLVGRDRKAAILIELIQNGWDQDTSNVTFELEHDPKGSKNGRDPVVIRVTDDDPNGWSDLTHAYTLFAPSEKKSDPSKRGRFNFGEKLVLSLCKSATITTVKGAVVFDKNGRRLSRKRRESGSLFEATLTLTKRERQDFVKLFGQLIPPVGIHTQLIERWAALASGLGPRQRATVCEPRTPVHSFELTLPTVISDEEGNLKRTSRKTVVNLYEPDEDEDPSIYELGLPVVGHDGRYHIDVQQKVPLNSDRDNVTPGYLADLQVAVLNETHALLEADDLKATWVTAAGSDERADGDAVNSILDARFGKKRVAYDPSDTESTRHATAQGYTVVSGGALPSGLWANAKKADAIRPAGVETPCGQRLFADSFSLTGTPLNYTAEADWSVSQRSFVEFTKGLSKLLICTAVRPLQVEILDDRNYKARAAFCGAGSRPTVTFNTYALGKEFYRKANRQEQLELLLHEFAHKKVSDHLSLSFADEVGRLGVQLALAVSQGKFEVN